MGKAIIVIQVFPAENADLTKLEAEIKKVQGYNKSAIEPFVFGAKIIRASFIYEDGKGIDYEEALKKIAGVSEIQVQEEGLIS